MRVGVAALALTLAAAEARSQQGSETGAALAIVAQLERLAGEQKGRHPLEARQLESRMRELGTQAKGMGPEVIAPLARLLGDLERPLKARVYAAEILGMHGDPEAFKPLKDCALDAFEDAGLRSAALQALAGVRISPAQRRRVLEAAIESDTVPAVVRAEAFDQLGELGASPELIVRAAARPDMKEADARNAARAIAASKVPEAPGKLAELLPALDGLLEGEAEALGLLTRLPRARLTRKQSDLLLGVLRRRRGPSAALAAKAVAHLGLREAPEELRRALKASDPLVVAEAADALVVLRDSKGARDLERLVANLRKDSRFSAKGGKDVAALAARIEAAAAEARGGTGTGKRPRKAAAAGGRAELALAPGALGPSLHEDLRRGVFRFDGFPGATRPEVHWDGSSALLFAEPDPASRSRRAKLPQGTLAWDQSVVWTLEAGEAMVTRTLTVEALDFGRFSGRLTGARGRAAKLDMRPGEKLEILGSRAEGDCFVRHRDRLVAMECPQFYPGPYDVSKLPVTEWWVRVDADGGPGWMTAAYRSGTAP